MIHNGNFLVDGILGTGNEASGGYTFPLAVGISGNSILVTPDGVLAFGDSRLSYTSQAPTADGSVGAPGQIEWDSNYLYICVAQDTWKRTPLADFLVGYVKLAGDTMIGQLVGISGSATVPSIVTGYTNTGIFSPAANTHSIATSGAERVRVFNDGGVQIGGTFTTSPGTNSLRVAGIVGSSTNYVSCDTTGKLINSGVPVSTGLTYYATVSDWAQFAAALLVAESGSYRDAVIYLTANITQTSTPTLTKNYTIVGKALSSGAKPIISKDNGEGAQVSSKNLTFINIGFSLNNSQGWFHHLGNGGTDTTITFKGCDISVLSSGPFINHRYDAGWNAFFEACTISCQGTGSALNYDTQNLNVTGNAYGEVSFVGCTLSGHMVRAYNAKVNVSLAGSSLVSVPGFPCWYPLESSLGRTNLRVSYDGSCLFSELLDVGSTTTAITFINRSRTKITTNNNIAITTDCDPIVHSTNLRTIKYVTHIDDGTNIRSSEIIAAFNGSTVTYTESIPITIGTPITGASWSVVATGGNVVLRLTVTSGTYNVRILRNILT